ncbi:MAG: FMN-binding protein, partial [Acidobacteriota bacterium]
REPAEYIPPALWYAQFDGRSLDEALQVERGIRGVTGATLTARATTEAVRRALAIHAVLQAADGTASEASNSASGRGDGGR